MRERNIQPMAVPWDRWRGIRIGEARVPGPFDFDDPEAQPFEQDGNSGDDWQLVQPVACCRMAASVLQTLCAVRTAWSMSSMRSTSVLPVLVEPSKAMSFALATLD